MLAPLFALGALLFAAALSGTGKGSAKPVPGKGGNGKGGGKGGGGGGYTPPPATPSHPTPNPPSSAEPSGTSDGLTLPKLSEKYSAGNHEAQIKGAILGGLGEWEWDSVSAEATIDGKHYEIEVPVMADAIKVDSVRVNGNYRTAQELADSLGMLLPTSKVADLVNQQAPVWIPVTTMPAGENMADTSVMVAASKAIDAKIAGRSGMVNNAGKWWVLTRRFWQGKSQNAANYGFFLSKAVGDVIQGEKLGGGPQRTGSCAHNLAHTDYSQTLRFMGPMAKITVNGEQTEALTADILVHPKLAILLSYEGALPDWRHPAIAYNPVA